MGQDTARLTLSKSSRVVLESARNALTGPQHKKG